MPIPNQIEKFIHCRQCLDDITAGRAGTFSPREYGSYEIGMTASGYIQVWCKRHELNVVVLTPQNQHHMFEETGCAACEPGSPIEHKH